MNNYFGSRSLCKWKDELEVIPPPFLPQMPTSTEFGGGEYSVGMYIFICAQGEGILPPFSSRCSSRDANGGS